jgi:hypothetical protein
MFGISKDIFAALKDLFETSKPMLRASKPMFAAAIRTCAYEKTAFSQGWVGWGGGERQCLNNKPPSDQTFAGWRMSFGKVRHKRATTAPQLPLKGTLFRTNEAPFCVRCTPSYPPSNPPYLCPLCAQVDPNFAPFSPRERNAPERGGGEGGGVAGSKFGRLRSGYRRLRA